MEETIIKETGKKKLFYLAVSILLILLGLLIYVNLSSNSGFPGRSLSSNNFVKKSLLNNPDLVVIQRYKNQQTTLRRGGF